MSTHLHPLATARARLDSPLGPLLLVRSARGLLGAWFDDQKHHPGHVDAPDAADDPLLRAAGTRLLHHLAGEAVDFDDLPLDPQGTAFQQAVWQALRTVPRGATSTYGLIARRLGQPTAVRAVGAAVGRNPLLVIVPCHRIVGRDGALTGFAGGLARKQALLRLERARLPDGRLHDWPDAGRQAVRSAELAG